MPKEQTYANHVRFDPAFHYFLAPVFLLNFLVSIGLAFKTFHAEPLLSLWRIVVAAALFAAVGLLRVYALRVQDRTIRLEECGRLAALLPHSESSRLISQLTMRQLIALRFASDAELPALAARAAQETLTPKGIKQAVLHWRSDPHRI